MTEQLIPEGEATRKAVKWVTSELKASNPKPLGILIDEASMRFNLSPADALILENAFRHPENKQD